MDRVLAFQLDRLDRKTSITGCQCLHKFMFALTLRPRYAKGNSPTLHGRVEANEPVSSSDIPIPKKELLWWLICSPEMMLKPLNSLSRLHTFFILGLPKKMTSSTKRKRVRVGPLLGSCSPSKVPANAEFLIKHDHTYIAMTKRKGDRGSLCLRPFWHMNSSVGLPLIKTEARLDLIRETHQPKNSIKKIPVYWVKSFWNIKFNNHPLFSRSL